jgi:hypothetical protein
MIDTIHIYTKSYNILESFDVNVLDNCTEHEGKSGMYYIGYIDNFRATYSETNLSFKGSLTKFLLENNVQNMNREQITEAFKKLEDNLRFDIGDFRISRIDLGVTFEMRSIIPMYLDSLIELPRYKLKTFEDETKSFTNKSKTITFYDKVEEFHSKKCDFDLTDLDINSDNLLRYELQIKKANKLLGKVTVNDINNDLYLKKLVNMWKNDFHKIKKNRKLIDIELIRLNKPKDFITFMFCDRIEEKGKAESIQLINKLCKIGTIDRRRKSDLKKRIETNEKKFCITSKYIDELETLINQHAEEFI